MGSPTMQVVTPPTVASEIDKKQPTEASTYVARQIYCPHCGEEVTVRFKLDLTDARKTPQHAPVASPIDRWRNTLTPDQHSILDAAKRNGLFDAFEWAMKKGSGGYEPKNMEKALLEWFRRSRPKIIPLYILDQFKALYPNKTIEFFAHLYVGAVVAGGNVSLFLPIELVDGTKVKDPDSGHAKVIHPDANGVRQWVKTKMGYVPVEGRVTLGLMRRRCIGEFARPAL